MQLRCSAVVVLATVCAAIVNAAPRLHKKIFNYPSHVTTLPGSYIVEFEENATDTHIALDAMASVVVRKRFDDSVFNGVVVATSLDYNPEMLADLPGVKRIWGNRRHTLAYQEGTQDLRSPYKHHMTGVARALLELGLDGRGVKIGIVDSGVDYNHPELGSCWKTDKCPWQYGKDFIGDEYDYTQVKPIVKPNKTPMDCMGHGTHISGIIAARGPQVQGVAPGATLGMYRVLSCPVNGDVFADDAIIMQGMEAAFKDGMDILSLSFGMVGWSEDPLAALATKMVEKGVVVVAAVGNDGRDGLQTASSPAVGRGVISVGSVENWNITTTATNITTPSGWRLVRTSEKSTNMVDFAFPKGAPLSVPKTSNGNIHGCTETEDNIKGTVAVVARGDCTFQQKADIVQKKGAVGMIVIDDGDDITALMLAMNITIPAVMVSIEDGLFIVEGVAKGKSKVSTNLEEYVSFASPDGGSMSVFSSFGPSPELDLVPMISAPGGNIWSTYPLKLGSYKSLSGTSMSTPYIAGVVALIKQARPKLTVDQIRQILVNSANPIPDPGTGQMVSPYSSGAGLVNAYNAIKSRAFVGPYVLSINQTEISSSDKDSTGIRLSRHNITFANTDGEKSAKVVLTNVVANSLTMYTSNGRFATSILEDSVIPTWPTNTSEVAQDTMPQCIFDNDSMDIEAGNGAFFNITIMAPYGLPEKSRWFYGGFLNFSVTWEGEDTSSTFIVPYGGFNGDYSKIGMLTPGPMNSPSFVDENLQEIKDIGNYKINTKSPPMLSFSIDVPSPLIYTSLIDAKNKSVGVLALGSASHVARSLPSSNGAYLVPVNNTVLVGDDLSKLAIAADGTYRLRLSVMRPFGYPSNDEDFEIWESGNFTFG
ncbi:hypothetical protein H4R20_000139 [Coemansia guatemalensis]|uniref:Subtilisin-like protein n=1 Tax=Coemansia guatemalensis TaxID=2761395 RepID=A0A9W8I1L2_9FUNG|nr:hypothetical protein H4R20_000139 [Coemansia guatemalensis]